MVSMSNKYGETPLDKSKERLSLMIKGLLKVLLIFELNYILVCAFDSLTSFC